MADVVYHAGERRGHGDAPACSFRLGYWFHLLADLLFGYLVYRPTKARFPEEFADPLTGLGLALPGHLRHAELEDGRGA